VSRPRRGIRGDWLVKTQLNERKRESILSFSRDADRNLTGQWISSWGVNDLRDVSPFKVSAPTDVEVAVVV
jgi:hypothetical protein